MMPAKFNLYSAWIDPYFYAWAAVFAAALFCLLYALRRWLQLRGADAPAVEAAVAAPVPEEEEQNPFLEPAAEEKTLVLSPAEQQAFMSEASAAASGELSAVEPAPQEEYPAQAVAQEEEQAAAASPAPQEEPAAEPAREDDHSSRAENFVRGIYSGIADLDERMKGIESALSKSHVNNDFAVTFLEDMLQDMDNLDKAKIRARLEYLVSDLKK